METLAARLARFVFETHFEDLPVEAVEESKRLLLDSIGCALASATTESGKIGVRFARRFSYPVEATIIGFGDRVSCFGAAFANGELIQAMDYQPLLLLPPGHVAPYVIPATLSVAEMACASGKDLILANAIAHEVSARIGLGLGYVRENVDGKTVYAKVYGHSSTIFGGTAGVGKIRGLDKETMSHALGIAGYAVPVQAVGKWSRTIPIPTHKYTLTGLMAQTELTSVFLAEIGHRGDITVFEGDCGFWRFIGSSKWDPEIVTERLGEQWRYPPVTDYKPYPCGRAFHAGMDAFSHIVKVNGLYPEEIERVESYIEALLASGGPLPIWHNMEICGQNEAQMSIPFCYALIAYRVKPGPEWQDWHILRNPRILSFMKKVKFPESRSDNYNQGQVDDHFIKKTRVNVIARGRVFSEEIIHPRGYPSQDSRMSNVDLEKKFIDNASRILPWRKIDNALDKLWGLENISDVSRLMEELGI